MTVGELVEELKTFPPEAEAVISTYDFELDDWKSVDFDIFRESGSKKVELVAG